MQAVDWAVAHLSERGGRVRPHRPARSRPRLRPGRGRHCGRGAELAARQTAGTLHPARLPGAEGLLTTDRAVADEKETLSLMAAGLGRGAAPMRARTVDKALRNGPLTHGQMAAVKLILAAEDRTVGVQGYAGTGKTTMLNRARALLEKKGYTVRGLAPSASAARTLAAEAGIESETPQRFLARYNGVAEGRMTRKGQREMRAAFAKTALVVDEGSLASTVQARDLLRIVAALEAVEPDRAKGREAVLDTKRSAELDGGAAMSREREGTSSPEMEQIRAPKSVDRELGL